MYCKNCSAPIGTGSTFCNACGAPVGAGSKYCPDCAWPRDPKETACSRCGAALTGNNNSTGNSYTPPPASGSQPVQPVQPGQVPPPSEPKSKMMAGLLGIFLGSFGVHNFYLGYNTKAIIQLVITVVTCGFGVIVTGIWGLIEGIMILSGNINTDANGYPLGE